MPRATRTAMTVAASEGGESARPPLWTLYAVRWDFITRMYGSVPAEPEVIEAWIRSQMPKVRPPGARSIDEIQEEVFESLAERGAAGEGELDIDASKILVFQRHEGTLVVRASTIKAHLKDCARQLSAQYIGSIQGQRAFSTRVINGCYPHERDYWVPIRRGDGTPVTKHDGEEDRFVHARGPRGEPRNALKRLEWIAEGARLEFTLRVLGRSVKQPDLETLFRYGGVHGYGGERSCGEGRYLVTITGVEEEA